MEIQSTATTAPTYASTTNVESKDNISATYAQAESNEPYTYDDILSMSFEDFKTRTDLGDRTKHDMTLAASMNHLWNIANGNITNDDILNEVMFDKAKVVLAKDGNTRASFINILGPIAIMDFPKDSIEAFIEHTNTYGNNDRFTFKQSNDDSKMSFPYTKEGFFNKMDSFKGYYEESLKRETEWGIDINAVFKYMSEIKTEYQNRISENSAALSQFLRT